MRHAGAPGTVLVLATMTHPSGAPIAALRLAAGLEARGWRCPAAFLYAREPMGAVDHGYECLLDRAPRTIADHLRLIRRLDRLIARERPDAVMGFLPLASVLGAVIGWRRGVRVRIVSHRVPTDTYGRAMRLLDRIAAWIGAYTDVIAVSRSVAVSCRKYPAALQRRIAVVYNGLKDWAPSPLSKADARARLGLPADALVLAAVGRLDAQKNYPLLIAGMAAAPAGAVLAVAGEGGLRGAIEADITARGIGDRVMLLGALPREDVPHLLAAADLFAQPSLFEGQSNALLEALHAGLPCLVSDVPEQVETVTDAAGAVAGAVLPLGDPQAWAAAIARFANDPQALAAARKAATRQAGEFTFERMNAGFADVLDAARARLSRNRASGTETL